MEIDVKNKKVSFFFGLGLVEAGVLDPGTYRGLIAMGYNAEELAQLENAMRTMTSKFGKLRRNIHFGD